MQTFNVALSANERYMMGATVAAAGVAVYASQETRIVFHLFTEKVSDEAFVFFEVTLKRLHERTSVVRHECDESILTGLPMWAGSRMAAVRCHYATLLPDVDWCLYLDCDVLYLASVEEHFSHADDTVYACVVQEESVKTRENECRWISEHVESGLVSPERYFNSGVMLFNFKKMRDDGIPAKLMQFFRNHPDVPSPDQDALNAMFGGCVKLIPPKFDRLQVQITDAKLRERPVVHYVSGNPWLPKYACVANWRFRLWHRFSDMYVWGVRGESVRRLFGWKMVAVKYVSYYILKTPVIGWLFARLVQMFGLTQDGVDWRRSQVMNDCSKRAVCGALGECGRHVHIEKSREG